MRILVSGTQRSGSLVAQFERHPLTLQGPDHHICKLITEVANLQLGFPGGSMAKNLLSVWETQETQVRPLGQEDSPGKVKGNPLQYSCLGKPMDKGAWRATVHRITKSQLSMQPPSCLPIRLQKI